LTVALLLANEAIATGLARWALLRAASGGHGVGGTGDGSGGHGVGGTGHGGGTGDGGRGTRDGGRGIGDGGDGGLAALPKALRRAFVLGPFAVAAAIMASLWAYGYVRAAGLAADAARSAAAGAPALRVGVVQANVTNYEKLRAEKGAFETVRSILDDHFALSDSLRRGAEPDFVVWPETVYPMTFGSPKSDAGAAFDADLLAFAAERKLPLVFGAYDRDGGGEGGREYNAAYFLSAPREGRPPAIATYRKGNLFPFTERVPRLVDSPWLREALPWVGGWHEGPGPTVVPLVLRDGRALSVAPLVCYDVVFSNFVAEAARQGADLLVTLSNDSWFPDERAPKLHLVAAAFRSVETRLPQVRATNSGISALIAPTGDILDGADWNQRRAFAGTLPPAPGGLTLAVRIAPYRGPALLAAAFVALAFELRRRRAAARAPSPPRAPSPARASSPARGAAKPAPAVRPADAAEPAPASGPADDAEPASTAGPTDAAEPAAAARPDRPARPAKGGARRKKRR
ncbi:MAG TPA: apolipoprotein N-acyltransferase, partial [Polyangiaceae bacterium]|nr:apolipoprotein N-acyltransferase [Polyangiaceae bacterium]